MEAQTIRIETLERKLDEVLSVLHSARGGWRTLMLIGGAAGAALAAVLKVISLFGGSLHLTK